MRIDRIERGDVVVFRLSGRVAFGTELAQLGRRVAGVVEEGRRRIVFDLGGVEYLDSAGLGEIVACRRLVNEAGGRVALSSPRGKVRDLLEITRLEQMVGIYASEDEAVGALAS